MWLTPKLGIRTPSEHENPFWDSDVFRMTDLDDWGFANVEDKNQIVIGEFSFNSTSGSLTWAEAVHIVNLQQTGLITIDPDSVSIADGQFAYVVVPRPYQTITLAVAVGSPPLADQDMVPIAYRSGDRVFIKGQGQIGYLQPHATTHVDGSDDIRDATNTQKGLATAAHIEQVEDNVDAIDVNASDISDNADAILVNAGDISDNADAISDNADAILVNAGDISDNADAIFVNAGAIDDNADDILSNTNIINAYLDQSVKTDASPTFTGVKLDINNVPAVMPGGTIFWEGEEYTPSVVTGLGPVLQIGHELYILMYNGTGSDIQNGKVLHPNGAITMGDLDVPTVELADARDWSKVDGTLFVSTMLIPNGSVGLASKFGKVRDIDLGAIPAGSELWVSDTTPGDVTDIKPSFPNFSIDIGGSLSAGADSSFLLDQTSSVRDIFNDAHDGSFLETFSFLITSNGTVITGSLKNRADINRDLTMAFSDGLSRLDVTPPATISLTPGTDENPQQNFVYILRSTKALAVSTSGFPVSEHIRIGKMYLQSAATTAARGALKNHNWNDHVKEEDDNGHLLHMAYAIREKLPATWRSGGGCQGTATVTTNEDAPDNVNVATTAGTVMQMHDHAVNAFNTATGDGINIVNDSASPLKYVTDLNGELTDAQGNSMSNNAFSLVIWAIVNSAGEPAQLMCNLPIDSYNVGFFTPLSSAINDVNNYATYDIPAEYQGTGFLIARFTFEHSTSDSGTWDLVATEDLRGKVPNVSAGGAAGGTGVTEFLTLTDTPSTYVSQAGKAPIVTVGETGLEFGVVNNAETIWNKNIIDPGDTMPSVGVNFVLDGNMEETGTTDWTGASSASVAKDATTKATGTQSLKISTLSGDNAGGATSAVSLETGVTYLAEVHVRKDALVNRIMTYNGADFVNIPLTKTNEFEFITFELVCVNSTPLSFFGFFDAASSDFDFWIDGVVLRKISAAPTNNLLPAWKARQNRFKYPDDFTQSSVWGLVELTINTDTGVPSPLGINYQGLVASVNNVSHYAPQVLSLAGTNRIVVKTFAKAGTVDWFVLVNTGTGDVTYVNIATGEIGLIDAGTRVHRVDYGALGCLIAIETTSVNGSNTFRLYPADSGVTATFEGDGSESIYLIGTQIYDGTIEDNIGFFDNGADDYPLTIKQELVNDFQARHEAGFARTASGAWESLENVDSFLMDESPANVAAMQQYGLRKKTSDGLWEPREQGVEYDALSVLDTHAIWNNDIKQLAATETAGGLELSTDGEFLSSTSHTLGTGWSIADGKATKVAGSTTNISQSISITVGVPVTVRFEISGYTGGSIAPYVGGSTGSFVTGDGIYEQEITPISTAAVGLTTNSTFAGSVEYLKANVESTISTVDRKLCAAVVSGDVQYDHEVDKQTLWNDGKIQHVDAIDAVSGWTATPVDGELYRPRGASDYEIRRYIDGNMAGQTDKFEHSFRLVTTIPTTSGVGIAQATFTTDEIIPEGESYILEIKASATLRGDDAVGSTVCAAHFTKHCAVGYDGEVQGTQINNLDGITGFNQITSLNIYAESDIDLFGNGGLGSGGGTIKFAAQMHVEDSTQETIIDWVFNVTGNRHTGVGTYC